MTIPKPKIVHGNFQTLILRKVTCINGKLRYMYTIYPIFLQVWCMKIVNKDKSQESLISPAQLFQPHRGVPQSKSFPTELCRFRPLLCPFWRLGPGRSGIRGARIKRRSRVEESLWKIELVLSMAALGIIKYCIIRFFFILPQNDWVCYYTRRQNKFSTTL